MNRNRIHQALLVAVIGSVAIVGCKKKEEAAPVPPPAASEPMADPMVTTVPTASVTGVDLGNATGPDMKLTGTSTTFKPGDKIIASVTTTTSDPAVSVAGKLTAKWSYMNGAEAMPVDEKTQDFDFAGVGTTNFSVNKPGGWPTGLYRVDISLDGAVVQSKEFTVAK